MNIELKSSVKNSLFTVRKYCNVFNFGFLLKNFNSVDLCFPSHVTSGAKDIISKLLKYRPEDRLDLKSILHHEWLQQHLTAEVRSK